MLKMNNYTVYMHITPSNKRYIGITKTNTRFRWKNGKSYKHCRRFQKAIEKYGWSSIKHVILYENLSKEDAYKKEQELISQYKSNNPKYGYNISPGGNVVSDETKKLISENTKIAMAKSEIRKKLSIAQSNRISPLKGRKLSEEHKRKISVAKKGQKGKKHTREAIEKMIKNNTRKKQVICIETNTVYESIKEAERQMNIDFRNIQRSCKNGMRAGGYHWKYYDLNKNESEER